MLTCKLEIFKIIPKLCNRGCTIIAQIYMTFILSGKQNQMMTKSFLAGPCHFTVYRVRLKFVACRTRKMSTCAYPSEPFVDDMMTPMVLDTWTNRQLEKLLNAVWMLNSVWKFSYSENLIYAPVITRCHTVTPGSLTSPEPVTSLTFKDQPLPTYDYLKQEESSGLNVSNVDSNIEIQMWTLTLRSKCGL